MSQEQNFTLTIDQSLDQQLGFAAYSLEVQNITGQWFYCKAADKYVAPYTINMIIAFPAGTQVASLRPETPAGQQSAGQIGEILRCVFKDTKQGDAAGISMGYGTSFQNMGGTDTFSISAVGTTNHTFAFPVYSLLVQNTTGKWLFYNSANNRQFIPPYTINVIIPVSPPILTARFDALDPIGQLSNPKAGEFATGIGSAIVQPASQGIALTAPNISNPPIINTAAFSASFNAAGGTVTLIAPAADGSLWRIISYNITLNLSLAANFGTLGAIVTMNEIATPLGYFPVIKTDPTANTQGVVTSYINANDSGLIQTITPNSAVILVSPNLLIPPLNAFVTVYGHFSYIKVLP